LFLARSWARPQLTPSAPPNHNRRIYIWHRRCQVPMRVTCSRRCHQHKLSDPLAKALADLVQQMACRATGQQTSPCQIPLQICPSFHRLLHVNSIIFAAALHAAWAVHHLQTPAPWHPLQTRKMKEIAQEQLCKKSAHRVSAVVRLQTAALGLLARWRVRLMHNLQLIQTCIPSQLLQVVLHLVEDLSFVRCVRDLGHVPPADSRHDVCPTGNKLRVCVGSWEGATLLTTFHRGPSSLCAVRA
jgi:hypothetical protein